MNARTVVVQSFRRHDVPQWMERCLESVRSWTALRGYEHSFHGDEFFDLCGPEYLARVGGNLRSITNLARLEMTRIKLAEGYDQVIWLDADVFVFDPQRFDMRTEHGYAFSREAWVTRNADGSAKLHYKSMHNAAYVFTRRQTDLELLIHIIRHTVMTRMIHSNFQVGVKLISGLEYSLDIPAIANVAMFSPDVSIAIANDDAVFVREFALLHGARMEAANLNLALREQLTEAVMMRAMDRLEASEGAVVNAYVGDAAPFVETQVRPSGAFIPDIGGSRQMQNRAEEEFLLAGMDLLLRGGAAEQAETGTTPYISVIMPVFNREWFVGCALESLRRQSFRHFEVIVVDDASADGTPGALSQWAEREPRIRIIRNESRMGVSASRNRGLAEAKGEVIAYLDSDNLFYVHALATIADAFKASPDAWSIYTAHLWSNADGGLGVRCPHASLPDLMAMRETFDLNAFAHRRGLYEAMGGFDERLTRFEDWEISIRYGKAVMARRVPVPTGHYRHGDWARVTNEASHGWNLHLASERHAPQLAVALRALIVIEVASGTTSASFGAEYRFLLERGAVIEFWSPLAVAPIDFGLPGDGSVKIHGGPLAEAITTFHPDIFHVQSASALDRCEAEILASGLPATLRDGGFAGSPVEIGPSERIPNLRSIYASAHGDARRAMSPRGIVKNVPASFDPALFHPASDKDRRLVVGSGSAAPGAGLDAFVEIAARCPKHRFVLCIRPSGADRGNLDALAAENGRLGSPVEIRLDCSAEETADWVRRAGIRLHSSDATTAAAFMPTVEALATGAIIIARDNDTAAAFIGCRETLYDTIERAAELIDATANWDDARWDNERRRCIEHAFAEHAPGASTRLMLDDWLTITGNFHLAPREAVTLETVEANEALFFGAAGRGPATLREGFHPPEAWGVWTGQANTTISFSTKGGDWANVRAIVLEAHANCVNVAAMTAMIILNGTTIGSVEIGPHHAVSRLDFAPVLKAEMALSVALQTSTPGAPRDVGSADPRRLGLALKRLSFVAA